ncbi:MAG: 3D domain-containing protein [Oscillospiraceae bacterium]|nr:3D domain-containing protein [Oscillospiraceae bacterium]MDY6208714.1 3D domain-containing protein [Oscillospiraceae bacterium]
MMNKIRQIFSDKLRLSGIRGCMAAGAVTAGIAALAVIGGVNTDDISTVSLETDVIPEETVTTEKAEKKIYSHDMEYFSVDDIERLTSEDRENSSEGEEEAEVNEAILYNTDSEETAENDNADDASADTDDMISEMSEQETEEDVPSEEEAETEEETSDTEEAAAEDISENSDDNENEQSEEEQEITESVSARISAAGGDEDNGGLSSALDLETEDSAETEAAKDEVIIVYESSASEETDESETPVSENVSADDEQDDIPEDITLDDEDESTAAPQDDAISLLDLPEWLTFDENGVPSEYVTVLTGNACAYTAAPDALMSTGKEVFQGYVAVDPDIIPYGSELYIVAEDGEVYGYAIAADTGYSVRKGHIIVDLFMNEYDDCIQWGNKPVNVYVLK